MYTILLLFLILMDLIFLYFHALFARMYKLVHFMILFYLLHILYIILLYLHNLFIIMLSIHEMLYFLHLLYFYLIFVEFDFIMQLLSILNFILFIMNYYINHKNLLMSIFY